MHLSHEATPTHPTLCSADAEAAGARLDEARQTDREWQIARLDRFHTLEERAEGLERLARWLSTISLLLLLCVPTVAILLALLTPATGLFLALILLCAPLGLLGLPTGLALKGTAWFWKRRLIAWAVREGIEG